MASSNAIVITYEEGDTPVEPVAPSITTQPNGASYEKDATATALTIVASGNPTPTYQWYSNTTESTFGASLISGATNASYTPSTATIGTKYYYCVATNTEGSATSDIVAVTVTAALPKITITDAQVTDFTNTYKEYTWTASDVSGKMYAYKSNGMQFNTSKDGYYVYNTDPIPGNIRSIKMTTHSSGTEREWKVSVGTEQITSISGDAGTEPTKKVEKTGTTWTITGNNQYFCLVDKSGASNISEIVITYEEDKTPTIEADIEEIAFEQKELSGTATDSKTISATGKNLTAAISASMKSGSATVFSVTPVGTPTTAAGKFTVSFSTTVAGEYTGTVVLSSGETSIEIPVSASVVTHIPVLQSIYVKGEPTKKEYTVGDAFETAGLEVWGKYDEGADQQITEGIEWTVDPETFETAGTASVDVMVGIGTFTSEVYTVENITVNEAPKTFTWDLTKDETATATTDEISWTSDIVSMKDEKSEAGTNSNNYYPGDKDSHTSTRFYKGSVLTITPVVGNRISKVEFTATSDGYATALQESSWTNATASASGKTVTVTPTDGTQAFSATIGGTCGFGSVKIYIYANVVEVNISAAGAATYSSAFPLDFTGKTVKAYVATGDVDGNKITMTRVYKVPAYTGLYLAGTTGVIPVIQTGTDFDETTGNKLKAVVTATTVEPTEGNLYNYVLQNQSGIVGFYYLTEARKIGANKAYLQLDEQIGNNAKVELFFDDEPTGIKDIQSTKVNVQGSAYNLNGIRVNENYKGIVIMDGKKYINK